MESWWVTLTGDEKVFFASAITSTILFIVQMLLVFLGGHSELNSDAGGHVGGAEGHDFSGDYHAGGHADTHAEGHTDSHGDSHHFDNIMGYFTIRNLTAFFMGFGWGGMSMKQNGYDTFLSTVVAIIVGLVFVFVVVMIMKALSKLRAEGTLLIANAVGATGTVSINIPEDMKGTGKISVVVQGRLAELEAITREKSALTRGQQVKVTEVSGSKLIVTKP